ncbi:hypothetical protein D3C71_1838610 [compost metagenome]
MRSAVAVAPRKVVSPSAFSEMFWPVSVVFCQVLLSEFALLLPTLASARTPAPACLCRTSLLNKRRPDEMYCWLKRQFNPGQAQSRNELNTQTRPSI